jgi:hypothetical protein
VTTHLHRMPRPRIVGGTGKHLSSYFYRLNTSRGSAVGIAEFGSLQAQKLSLLQIVQSDSGAPQRRFDNTYGIKFHIYYFLIVQMNSFSLQAPILNYTEFCPKLFLFYLSHWKHVGVVSCARSHSNQIETNESNAKRNGHGLF